MDVEQLPRLIQSDSPLWRLPQGLDPLQASFLDAIRLSVQFVDVAYERIETALANLTLTTDRSLQLGPVAVMDAWTIVDVVHRLRALIGGMPRYKNRAPSKRLFLLRTVGVETLRNSFQHLVNDLQERTQLDLPVLGALTWVRPISTTDNTLSVETFVPGQFRSIDPSNFVAVPSEVPDRLEQIELWVGVDHVDITSLRQAVVELVLAMESAASDSNPAGLPPTLCDAMAKITVRLMPIDEHKSHAAIPRSIGDSQV